jgi:FKBP-type peptidyl-prolyl cis-trans isomerase FkpA
MIKRFALATLAGITAISFTACNSNEWKKTKDGLEYKILVDKKEGKGPSMEDYVKVNVRIYYAEKGKKDTLLNDIYAMNGNQAIEIPVNVPLSFKSDWPSGLNLMTPGDSAIFRTPVDTIMKLSQGQLPAFMKKGGHIVYSVVLVSVRSGEAMKQEQAQKSASQVETDDKAIQDFIAQNNLKATKTESGLYYVITKEGSGNALTNGQEITMNYTGKTLDGKPFDSNVDPQFQHVQPFKFKLGAHQVIQGWDEGVALLKKGSQAVLLIPSALGYGSQGQGAIPANAVLVFNVEVVDATAPTVQ